LRIAGLVIGLILTGVIAGSFYVSATSVYVTGTATVGHMDLCTVQKKVPYQSRSSPETVCTISWTDADNHRHAVTVTDVMIDDPIFGGGTDLRVKVRGDEVVLDSPVQLWPLLMAAMYVVSGLAVLIAILTVDGRSRRA
jgi:hypothetical protein